MWLSTIEESKGQDVIVTECPSYGVVGFASVGNPRDLEVSAGAVDCYFLDSDEIKIAYDLPKNSYGIGRNRSVSPSAMKIFTEQGEVTSFGRLAEIKMPSDLVAANTSKPQIDFVRTELAKSSNTFGEMFRQQLRACIGK